jgi:hypothetical protein
MASENGHENFHFQSPLGFLIYDLRVFGKSYCTKSFISGMATNC